MARTKGKHGSASASASTNGSKKKNKTPAASAIHSQKSKPPAAPLLKFKFNVKGNNTVVNLVHRTNNNKSHSNNNNNKNKRGDQSSYFGPLRFPEQLKRKVAQKLASKSNNNSNNYNNASYVQRRHDDSYRVSGQQQQQQQQHQRRRDKFQLRLPASTLERPVLYKDMAWYEQCDEYSANNTTTTTTTTTENGNCESTARKESSSSSSTSEFRLPTDFLSSDALQQLSRELHSFASYVRLQPLEHEARQYMIQSLANLAGTTFAGQNNNNNRNNNKNSEDVHLQVFGSYATPQVCTFSSDVDMALWGVVPVPQHTNLMEEDEESHHDDDDDADDQLQQHDQEQRNNAVIADKMEQKVQKWRNLLQELEDQQEQEDEQKSTRSNGNTSKPATAPCLVDRLNSEVEVPFFVLDSVGDVDDDENDETVHAAFVEQTETSLEVIDLVDSEEEDKEVETVQVSDSTRDDIVVDLVDSEDEREPAQYVHNDDDDDDSDSDVDSADKLESMLSKRPRTNGRRPRQHEENEISGKSDSPSSDDDEPANKRRRRNYDDDDPDSGFEVSFHSQVSATAPPPIVGPVGATRTLVVRALQSLKNGLHKNRMFSTVGIRRFARVPIVTMESRLGFEGDVAIGGHNGTDTSQFAATLVERYNSFAPVVLFLKILLNQQCLDKPFTGGLGSYKLYVLVCHHLERHISLGGSDNPGEVLASFFYRFARHTSATRSHKVAKDCISTLTKDSEVECKDGLADLKPCHNLAHCVELFSICWQRLSRRLSCKDSACSYLGELIRPTSIRTQRQDSLQRASNLSKYRDEKTGSSLYASNNTNRPFTTRGPMSTAGQKIAQIFSNRPPGTNQKRSKAPSPPPPPPPASLPKSFPPISKETTASLKVAADGAALPKADASEEELLRGYGVRRSINGTLIPRTRPDVEQKRSTSGGLAELFGRVSKNRKNKKKQARDRNLQAIARNVMK